MLDRDEGESKFRSLREGAKLNQISVNQHFVLTDLLEQAVQLITYEAKKLECGGSVPVFVISK